MSISTFFSRRMLLQASSTAAAVATANAPASTHGPGSGYASFDANVVMILSVLLCALFFSLGLNAILKCVFRCSSFFSCLSMNNARFPSPRLVHPGVRRNALKTFPTVEFSKEVKLPGLDSECIICLAEFEPGELLRLLPKCFHGFHVQCIDKWLSAHTTCPKCRNCLTQTCRKVVGCSAAAAPSEPVPAAVPAESNVVEIAPLERETVMCNYRESR